MAISPETRRRLMPPALDDEGGRRGETKYIYIRVRGERNRWGRTFIRMGCLAGLSCRGTMEDIGERGTPPRSRFTSQEITRPSVL